MNKNNRGRKILYDRDDLLNAFEQTKHHANRVVEQNFDTLYRKSIPYKYSSYSGALEKKEVMESINEWINSAFNIVTSNVEGQQHTPILTEDVDDYLIKSVEQAELQVEQLLEKVVQQRKSTAETAKQLVKLSSSCTHVDVEVHPDEEEQRKEEEPILLKLKRPLEQVKADYANSYQLLEHLDEELENKKSKLESYQSFAKQQMERSNSS